MMTIMVRILAVPLLLVACSEEGKSTKAPKAERVEFVSAKELDQMKAELDAEVAANAVASCERPALRGPPIEGSAELQLRTVFELSGTLAPCAEAASAINFETDLVGANLEDVYQPNALKSVTAACALLPEQLRQAVSHTDGCSPIRIGRKIWSKGMGHILGANVATVYATLWAREGRPLEAIELLLGYIRFAQDLSRGGVSIVVAMSSYAVSRKW